MYFSLNVFQLHDELSDLGEIVLSERLTNLRCAPRRDVLHN